MGAAKAVSPDIVYVDIEMPLPMLQVYEKTSTYNISVNFLKLNLVWRQYFFFMQRKASMIVVILIQKI